MQTLSWDSLFFFLGGFFGVIGSYTAAIWNSKSETRNIVLLELHGIEQLAEQVLNTFYANNNKLELDIIPMQQKYFHPIYDSISKIKESYPLLNQKTLRLIEGLHVQTTQYELILSTILHDYKKVEHPDTASGIQGYSFHYSQNAVNEFDIFIKCVRQLRKSIKNPFYLFIISKMRWFKNEPTLHP